MESRENIITFICWLWDGWRPIYGPQHVNALARMLKDYGPKDYRLICVTDMPKGITECMTYPLWDSPVADRKVRNCFARLKLFNERHASRFGRRLVSIDLDVVIMNDIAPLFENLPDFKAVKGFSSLYNGSMWTLRPGVYPEVWDDFDPVASPAEIAARRESGERIFGSDQAWMSIKIPDGELWTEEDGVLQYLQNNSVDRRRHLPAARMVFFAGKANLHDSNVRAVCRPVWEQYQRYLNA